MSNQSKKRHYGGFRLENNNNDVKLKYNFDLSAPIIRYGSGHRPVLPVSTCLCVHCTVHSHPTHATSPAWWHSSGSLGPNTNKYQQKSRHWIRNPS